MNFSQLFLIMLARRKIILFTLVMTVATTLLVSLLLPKTYKAVTTLLLTHKGADPLTGMIFPAQLMSGYMATQLDVIQSTSTALMVVDQLGLDQNETVKQQFEDSSDNDKGKGNIRDWLAALLLKNLSVEPSRESSVIRINFKGADPVFVAVMANAFANAYQEISIRLTVEPSQKAAVYFAVQINVLRDRLETAQKKLSQYQQEEGIVNVDYRLDVETARLNELSSQLVMAQGELMGATSGQDNNNRGGEGHNIVTNTLINSLKVSLSQAESRFSDISQKLGSNHPSYAGAKAEVEKLRLELNRHIRATTHNAISREAGIHAALEEQKTRVLALNRARNELQLLVREVEGAQQAYDSAMQRLNQTSLEGQSDLSSVSLLDPAIAPVTPDSPKILLNMFLSVFLGTLLGLGFGLLAEMLDRRIRSAEDLLEVLQAPVLGVMEWGAPKQRRFRLSLPFLKPRLETGRRT
ncbi:MAG: chain length determinant protein EpsF [Nitrosomonas sp.]|nr:chain length determinant protein EpsF [Nitrosomonas sp.]MDP1949785.1 chain length determinant protein EpsF [Nitrosomonas sp.]